ncbi:hypothetical protein J7J23_01645 [bacterium]|nr:hypothetical protein [bacterium]
MDKLIIFAIKIIFYSSLFGIFLFLFLKIPKIRALPLPEQKIGEKWDDKNFSSSFKKMVKKMETRRLFSKRNKIEKGKQTNQQYEEKPDFSDDYWEKIKNK